MQGIYNKIDKAAAQKYALARAGFNFRKWMIPAWNRRFKTFYTNYELQDSVEGYYRTFGKFMWAMTKDLKDQQLSLAKSWGSLTDMEKANVRRSMAELSFFLACGLLVSIISGLKENDDDDNWALNMTAYQANRIFTEIGAFTPSPYMLSEGFKLIDNPLPATSQMAELKGIVEFWDWFDVIEQGKYKDMRKIQKTMIRSVPPFKAMHDLFYPEEKLKFFNKTM